MTCDSGKMVIANYQSNYTLPGAFIDYSECRVQLFAKSEMFLLPLLLSCLVSFAAPEVFLVKTANKENQIISTKSKNQHSQDKMSKNYVTEQGGSTA